MSCKTWFYTLNNFTEQDRALLKAWSGVNYHIIGNEVGESGTPHLQGVITFKKTKRLSALKKMHAKMHWEVCKDKDSAINYCMKEKNYEIIDNREQGRRSDLEVIKQSLNEKNSIAEICEFSSLSGIRFAELYLKYKEKERPVKPIEFLWLYGGTGTGKSRYAYDHYEVLFKPVSYKWWEGYDGHKTVLIDDFRKDFCKFHELLKLSDIYPLRVETKGASRQAQFSTLIITTPFSPYETYDTREDVNQLLRRITKLIKFEIINNVPIYTEEKICLSKKENQSQLLFEL